MNPVLPGNSPLRARNGQQLGSLTDINRLELDEKERIYAGLLPLRLFDYLQISPQSLCGADGLRRVTIIAPEGMALLRLEVRHQPDDTRPVFFLDLAETHFHQMELAFCIIRDPFAQQFDVDLDENGAINYFASHGRNIPEELAAMKAGLYPNQTSRGLTMFGEFFAIFERFVDALSMDMVLAEPLTYDNAIRYEKYGFDYLSGRRLMGEIDREFAPGGELYQRMDGSTPFRMRGMETTVHGRSWALHDGVRDGACQNPLLEQPWDEVKIYKTVGVNAGVTTFRNPSP